MIHDTAFTPSSLRTTKFESIYGTEVSLSTDTLAEDGLVIEFDKDGVGHPNAIVDVQELREHIDKVYPPKGKVIPIRPSLEDAKRDLFDAALIPDDDMIHEGEEFVMRDELGEIHFGVAACDFPHLNHDNEWRLLEPRNTPEPSEEEVAADALFDDLEDLLYFGVRIDIATRLAEAGWRKTA